MKNNEVYTRTEYIEREAAREKCCSMCEWEGTGNCDECEHPIDDIPAADVAPVRHGRWVEVEVKEFAYYKMMIASMRCDQCGRYHNEVYHYGNPTEMAKYCGFCGARMDGDGDV